MAGLPKKGDSLMTGERPIPITARFSDASVVEEVGRLKDRKEEREGSSESLDWLTALYDAVEKSLVLTRSPSL